MKKIILLFLIFLVLGCNNQQICIERFIKQQCNLPCIIYIQPYEDFTLEEVNEIIPEVEKQFNYWLQGKWVFKILNPISFPKVNKYNNKYEALDFLNYQVNTIKNDEIIIGLTHKDICKDLHNMKHYGIMGLSYCPGNVCIVSDKRVKDKSNLWKVILHEFMHTYYGAKHCPNDDPTCFMVDAKGKGNLKIENKLCNHCKKIN